jgi:hypothetical protein
MTFGMGARLPDEGDTEEYLVQPAGDFMAWRGPLS